MEYTFLDKQSLLSINGGNKNNVWANIKGLGSSVFSGSGAGSAIGGVIGSFAGPEGTAAGAEIGGVLGAHYGAAGWTIATGATGGF